MNKNETPKPLVAFYDESDSFMHGFEAGQIWNDLQNGRDVIKRPIHTPNAGQLRKICEFFGYEFIIESLNAEWYLFSATLDIHSKL